jgi:hypothetical protein
MRNDTDHTLFQVGEDSSVPERTVAAPAVKTWVTPKVITSTLVSGDTASSFHNSADQASVLS